MGFEDLRRIRRSTQRKKSRGASEVAPPFVVELRCNQSVSIATYWLLLF
jgi:hypothetical protein